MRPILIRKRKTTTAGRLDLRAPSGRRARRAFTGQWSRRYRRQADRTLTTPRGNTKENEHERSH